MIQTILQQIRILDGLIDVLIAIIEEAFKMAIRMKLKQERQIIIKNKKKEEITKSNIIFTVKL